jgi:hypothetical protein
VTLTPTLWQMGNASGDSITPLSSTRPTHDQDETRFPTAEPEPPIETSPAATAVSPTASAAAVRPTIEIELNMDPAATCLSAPRTFDTRTATGSNDVLQMSFLNDQTITFGGWAPRTSPRPEDTSTAAALRLVVDLDLQISYWRQFVEAQLNLETGEFITQTARVASLLSDPCQGQCILDVVSESPDGNWQLIQVSDSAHDDLGFWVAGHNETAPLVNHVPIYSTWQWTADSSVLWFVHSLYEYGAQAVLAQLDISPIVVLTDEMGGNPLFDVTRNVWALDPVNKTIQLTPSKEAPSDTDELVTFDLTEMITQPSSIRVVPGIKGVVWNEATRETLLIIVQSDGLAITDLDGQILVKIPVETFEMIFPALTSTNSTFDSFLPDNNYALSPSGRYLAVGYGKSTGIDVYECQENP